MQSDATALLRPRGSPAFGMSPSPPLETRVTTATCSRSVRAVAPRETQPPRFVPGESFSFGLGDGETPSSPFTHRENKLLRELTATNHRRRRERYFNSHSSAPCAEAGVRATGRLISGAKPRGDRGASVGSLNVFVQRRTNHPEPSASVAFCNSGVRSVKKDRRPPTRLLMTTTPANRPTPYLNLGHRGRSRPPRPLGTLRAEAAIADVYLSSPMLSY
ncbi:hypothetical protein EYF80_005447 [Liparis tanakae]|uniref:Uncharacterized protein n=1 Tax=Liparis tanakae TaxID=230148 RepID=A0A4Z2J1I0_9TELE|nr:hypothetical protein EYF80_005447 [Liparis tanakae]